MIPVLYASDATDFKSQGVGALPSAISCYVDEERNGSYELEMNYPISGEHFEEMKLRSIIKAVPSPHRAAQPFRIYDISKPLNGIVKIRGRHLSYDLSGIPVKPFKIDAGNPQSILSAMITNSAVENPFTAWSDVTDEGGLNNEIPRSFRSLLGDDEDSILSEFGEGEFEFDIYDIKFHAHRGTDKGCVIEYGKNMTDLNHEETDESTITGILPYWRGRVDEGENMTVIMLDDPVIKPDQTLEYNTIAISDFSDYFDSAPSVSDLQQAAEEYLTNLEFGKTDVHLKVSFVDMGDLDKCDLCDTVTIRYTKLGVNESAKITKIRTNVLLDRYESIEVGDPKNTIADRIAGVKKIEEKIPSTADIREEVNDITNTVVGRDGGHYFIEYNDEEHPNQPTGWCIMDTNDKTTATYVWKFTEGGLAHSSNGYGGPYNDVALTMDGKVLANELLLTDNEYLSAYIKAVVVDDVATLTIGSGRNPYILKLESDRVGIYQGETCLTYWTNNSFILNTLKEFVLGEVKMVAQSNGSISIINA